MASWESRSGLNVCFPDSGITKGGVRLAHTRPVWRIIGDGMPSADILIPEHARHPPERGMFFERFSLV
jgi:hypothetical protein